MTNRILFTLVCLAVGFTLPKNSLIAGGRQKVPNEVNIELGGKCLVYSFSYQRMLGESFGLEAGISMLGAGSSENSASILFLTGGAKFYFLQGNGSPYVGAGIVGVTGSTGAGPFSNSATATYGYINPGFEYRWEGGFLLRGSVYALITSGGFFFIWPGLSVGIAF